MSKKRKFDKDDVLSEPIGHYWQRLLESSEKSDILILVKSEAGDVMLKVYLMSKLISNLHENAIKFTNV